MLALLSERPQAEVNAEWEGRAGYSELKKAVSSALSDFLYDFQLRLAKVDEQELLSKLEASEKAMREVAAKTLLGVQIAVGLRP
jgi:tryptophanyl-tRNA synthetase